MFENSVRRQPHDHVNYLWILFLHSPFSSCIVATRAVKSNWELRQINYLCRSGLIARYMEPIVSSYNTRSQIC